MNNKVSIEVFPEIMPTQTTECCEGVETDELMACCSTSNEFGDALGEYKEFKNKLIQQYAQNIRVQIYDYSLPMDRALAKRKLMALVKERGYHNIQGDHVLEFVTPAIVINGNLVSFATKVEYENLEKAICLLGNNKAI